MNDNGWKQPGEGSGQGWSARLAEVLVALAERLAPEAVQHGTSTTPAVVSLGSAS